MKNSSLSMHLYTRQEVSSFLNLSLRTVDRHIAAGKLRVHKLGRTVRISEDDLRAFLALSREV